MSNDQLLNRVRVVVQPGNHRYTGLMEVPPKVLPSGWRKLKVEKNNVVRLMRCKESFQLQPKKVSPRYFISTIFSSKIWVGNLKNYL